MEGETDDCLYEGLPGMFDTSPSLSDGNLLSLSANEENPSSLSLIEKKLPESDTYVKNNVQPTAKRCACRENVQWTWDSNSKSDGVEIINEMDVRFHSHYSNGTAVVRCTEPMTNNQYYWELKMTYPVYGTDVMVGVGTADARLSTLQDRFVSLLGMDNNTWGFSYTGLFHHNGQRRCYAQSFGQGSTIGVHLDLWNGTLSFYKDRKHLGVASSGLKGKTLYAMASSTAARSGMRIVRSCSFPSSLQYLCCAKLREVVPDDKDVLDVVGVPPGLKHFLRNKLGWLLDKRHLEQNFKTCCSVDDSYTDKEEIVDESSVGNVIGSSRISDPFSVTGQFILLGSVLLSNHNRFQRAARTRDIEDREDPHENESKRRRSSYNYAVSLPDHDSDSIA